MEEPVVEVVTAPDGALADDVERLVAAASSARGAAALGEARLRALRGAADGTGASVLAVTVRVRLGGRLVGYAQIDHEGDRRRSNGEAVVHVGNGHVPDGGTAAVTGRLVTTVLDAFATLGGGRLRWWAGDAGDEDDALAAAHGLILERELRQLRCPLPLPAPTRADEVVPTRPFRVGHDESAWIATNNRAFAGHPEQGAWELATLVAREAEAWFDPDGFRVFEVDGVLAASCWTKVHVDERPVLGEIYVISVDPAFHGRGLGRALTRAGLDWLAGAGITTGMLYVDGANAAAVSLYASMGFTVHHVDRAYVGEVPGHAR